MRMIKLTKVAPLSRYADTDDVGEPDSTSSVEVMVNVEAIRCFYARKDNRPGTRLTFLDGGGFAVTQSYVEVATLIAG
jgi:hypothetical protein